MDEFRAADGLRVLVVDACVDTTCSLAMLLNLWGHDVRTAHDGVTALDVARGYRPDAWLMDVSLPGRMDGYAVARALRGRPDLWNALLVCVTGHCMPADRRLIREAGFDCIFAKGADPRALRTVLSCEKLVRPAETIVEWGDWAAPTDEADATTTVGANVLYFERRQRAMPLVR